MALNFKGRKGTVNQTGRIRIKREDYNLSFDWPAEGCASIASLTVICPEALSDSSRIFLDVNHKTNFMRFDCGTKSNFNLPKDLELTYIGRNAFTSQIRIVDTDSGIVVARSAPFTTPTPDPKTKKIGGYNNNGEKQVQLFVVEEGDFEDLNPVKIEYPTSTQKPVVLRVNSKCQELIDELCEVSRAGIWVLTVLPHLRCILQRLVSECRSEEFDPSENIHQNSKWQVLWNQWATSHAGKGLQDIEDIDDYQEVDLWIESVLTNFCSTIGNPIKQVNRLMDGA